MRTSLKRIFVNKIKNKKKIFDLHQMNIKLNLQSMSLKYDIFQYNTKNHYKYFMHF